MKPIIVNDAEVVYGGDINKLIPEYKDIPKEFKSISNKWAKVFNDWFFCGLKDVEWKPKQDINVDDALRHIEAVMRSWACKQEHKEAGCAYLMSEFFEDVKYRK